MTHFELSVQDAKFSIEVRQEKDGLVVSVDGRRFSVGIEEAADADGLSVSVNGRKRKVAIVDEGSSSLVIHVGAERMEFLRNGPGRSVGTGGRMEISRGSAEVKSPLPGRILSIHVKKGSRVKERDQLFVIESMKMETSIESAAGATITAIHVKPGDFVQRGQVIMTYDRSGK
jgi:biotin carboxyl carrier protein